MLEMRPIFWIILWLIAFGPVIDAVKKGEMSVVEAIGATALAFGIALFAFFLLLLALRGIFSGETGERFSQTLRELEAQEKRREGDKKPNCPKRDFLAHCPLLADDAERSEK